MPQLAALGVRRRDRVREHARGRAALPRVRSWRRDAARVRFAPCSAARSLACLLACGCGRKRACGWLRGRGGVFRRRCAAPFSGDLCGECAEGAKPTEPAPSGGGANSVKSARKVSAVASKRAARVHAAVRVQGTRRCPSASAPAARRPPHRASRAHWSAPPRPSAAARETTGRGTQQGTHRVLNRVLNRHSTLPQRRQSTRGPTRPKARTRPLGVLFRFGFFRSRFVCAFGSSPHTLVTYTARGVCCDLRSRAAACGCAAGGGTNDRVGLGGIARCHEGYARARVLRLPMRP